MRFSIIIPAHNAEGHIRRALDSIKSQTFTDYELIVVCDACTDRTEEIAKEYGAKTVNVNYHRDGLSRNKGLTLACGDYVLFMDDDDWWLHEYVLELIDQYLDQRPNLDVLCFSFIFKGMCYATPRGNRGDHWIACWNKCYRRNFIRDCQFSAEWGRSDVTFYYMVMNKNPKLNDWDMPMYYYNYMRKGSITEMGY